MGATVVRVYFRDFEGKEGKESDREFVSSVGVI